MSIIFQCVSELQPGPKWLHLFKRLWPAYHQWFLKQGDHARPIPLGNLHDQFAALLIHVLNLQRGELVRPQSAAIHRSRE